MSSPPRDDSTPPSDGDPADYDDPDRAGYDDSASANHDDPDRAEFDDPVGDLLPRSGVDSRWWYWIAAIPLYVLVGAAFGTLFVGIALLGLGFGVEGGLVGFGLFFVLVVVLGLAGLVLTILFPIATYVDARAVAASDASWTPDPLVWGLAALATVVLSAFTLSFVLAVYYLYKRHVAVGTP